MSHLRYWICCGVTFAVAISTVGLRSAEARPGYLKVFKEVYAERTDTAKCALCHKGKMKTERTEYGTAVGEALGKKNVRDDDAVKKALKEVEGKLPREAR